MKTFYFTFGLSESYPYQGGWVEVLAPDRSTAVAIYRAAYPDKTPGIINCSDIYYEKAFLKSSMIDGNFGHKCWETLRLERKGSGV